MSKKMNLDKNKNEVIEIYVPEPGNLWCNSVYDDQVWKNPEWITWPSELTVGTRIRLEDDAVYLYSFEVMDCYHNFFLLRGKSLLKNNFNCILYWPIFDTEEGKDDWTQDTKTETEKFEPSLETIDEHYVPVHERLLWKAQGTFMTRMYLFQNISDESWGYIKLRYTGYNSYASDSLRIDKFPVRLDKNSPLAFTPKRAKGPFEFSKMSDQVRPVSEVPKIKRRFCIVL